MLTHTGDVDLNEKLARSIQWRNTLRGVEIYARIASELSRRVCHITIGTRIPVFVLTSEATISAAEAFAFIMQDLGRASVIGGRTPGMANPSRTSSVGGALELTAPFPLTRYGKSRGTFAGVGVKPGIPVSTDKALDIALDEIGITLESEEL